MTDPGPAGQHTLRRHNSALVLRTIVDSPGISRAAVAGHTGLAKATVSSLVDRLLAADLVAETGQVSKPGRGRPSTGLAPSATGPHGLGVEIGVDYLATCLVDLTGQGHQHRVHAGDNRARSVRQVLAGAARAIRTALTDADRLGVPVGGIGIAVPGLVEAATGRLRLAPNLGWPDLDLVGELRARLATDLPMRVGNEADFAAAAELARLPPDGPRDFVLVSGEIGIGGGLVLDGRPFTGVRGFAGELGHLPVDPAGPACACGANGCLERLAGLEWILRAAGIWPADSAEVTAPQQALAALVTQLTSEDPAAQAAVLAAGRWLGIGLAGVVNLVDVPCVLLGGSYAALAPWLRTPLLAELDRRVISARLAPVQVASATLGAPAAVLGAGAAPVLAIIADPEAHLAGQVLMNQAYQSRLDGDR